MLILVVGLRLAVAAVLSAAAAAKLADPLAAGELVDRYRLPRSLAWAVPFAPAAELAVAAALVVDATSRAAGGIAAALVGVFSAVVVRSLRRGGAEGCGCFGTRGRNTSARTALLRNAAIVGASVAVAAAPAARAPFAAVALGLAVVAASLAAAVRGRRRSVPAEHRILLFLDSGCFHCRSLLPVLRAWSRRDVTLHVVTHAGLAVDDELAEAVPSSAALVVDGGALARRYHVEGTPTAVVLDREDHVRRTVVGAPGIEALLTGAVDDDRRRLDGFSHTRFTLDRRRVLALGAGSAVAAALPGTSLGANLATLLAGQSGVTCPPCGECTICEASGSPVKLTCRPCKQKCSAHQLCANYANKLPAYVELASYLRGKGFTQSKAPSAQGLQQSGQLTVFGTTTSFTSSSTQTPRAVLFYTLTNAGGNAWVALMDAKGHVASVGVVGPNGKVTETAVPPVKLTKGRETAAAPPAGYGCGKTCQYVAEVSLALFETGVTAAIAPEEVGLEFADALFSASKSLVLPSPSGVNSVAQDVYDAIQAGSMLEAVLGGMKSKAIDAFCNDFICTYSLQACCSYGSCYDSLSACAKSCPESLKYQAPCLVYLTGHGSRTYLGRF